MPDISTAHGIIITSLVSDWEPFYKSIVLYSTIPIVDSNNKLGPSVKLVPPMKTSVSSLQFLRCSQSLVNQNAVLDTQSATVMVYPSIEKNVSSWAPFHGPEDGPVDKDGVPLFMNSSVGNLFLDAVRESCTLVKNSSTHCCRLVGPLVRLLAFDSRLLGLTPPSESVRRTLRSC
jgi:hypothetical protein